MYVRGQTRPRSTNRKQAMSILANPQVYVPSKYPSLQPRKKRQRYDKRVLPMPTAIEGDEVFDASELERSTWRKLGTARKVGECTRCHPMEGRYYVAWCYEVTLLDGTIVPATQLQGSNYVLVQDLSHKAKTK